MPVGTSAPCGTPIGGVSGCWGRETGSAGGGVVAGMGMAWPVVSGTGVGAVSGSAPEPLTGWPVVSSILSL